MRRARRSHPRETVPPRYVKRRALLTLLAVLAIGLAFLFSTPTHALEGDAVAGGQHAGES